MDYLDPQKQLRRHIMLFVGYITVAIAIVIASLILLNMAYGFSLSKGVVIQNGLVFFSSHPSSANIYINGKQKATTNTRLYIPEGIYNISVSRSGYNDWHRTIELAGGSVQHFDYPFLIPKTLTTSKLTPTYAAAPTLMTQSPDRRWLLVGRPNDLSSFDVYDLKNPTKTPVVATLPASLISKATSGEGWQLVDWADDNQHVLLRHDFDGKGEFVLLNRADATQSYNLNTTLATNPAKLTLVNKKYDQYYAYDSNGTLQRYNLKSTQATSALQHVLAYQSYGTNTVLYVTDSGAASGKVLLKLRDQAQTYNIRSFPASPSYVLDLTQYSGTTYVAAGAFNDSRVYIYQDPAGQLISRPKQAPVPTQVLRLDQPNYLSFSDNAQFIVAESGSSFGVYDIENQNGYHYTAELPDAPQVHASWMDGDRLAYVNGGKLIEFDYDHTNQHDLLAADGRYEAAFAPDYKYVYTLNPNSAGQYSLNQTWLLAPADR